MLLGGCPGNSELSNEEARTLCSTANDGCMDKCTSRQFNTCYIDRELFPEGPYDMVTHCYATHVGEMCYPCTHRYSVSFGGSLRTVSCDEFVQSLHRKNRQCGDCLMKYGESPFKF